LISEASQDEATELLEKAVQILPQEVDLWLAHAKLLEYHRAREVLNQALSHNQTSLKVYIAAAQLEEAQT
jgi:pre-mRNA-processing factor 6